MSRARVNGMATQAQTGDVGTDLLVDRDAEIRLLRRKMLDVQAGQPGVVTIAGQAGTGRTTLLREALVRARTMGLATALVRCSPSDSDVPFGVLSQLTTACVTIGPGWLEHTAGLPSADLIPLLCHDFLAMARRQPLLVAIDDVHWADAASRRWLSALFRRLHDVPLLIIRTFRGDPADTDSAGRVDHPLTLGPLTPDGVRRLAVFYQSDPEFAAGVADVAGTNPAVLRAALDELVQAGLALTGEQLPTLALKAAGRTTEQVARLIRDLPTNALTLLRAMAVYGDNVPMDLIRSLVGTPAVPIQRLVRLLVAEGLVRPGERPHLAGLHVAEQALAAMPASDRADWYRKAAFLGYQAAIPDDEVSRLLMSALPVGEPWAVDVLASAAAQCLDTAHYRSASEILRRALREPVTDAQRRALLVKLAAAEMWYAPESAERLLRQSMAVPDPQAESAVLVLAADLLYARGNARLTRYAIAAVLGDKKVGYSEFESGELDWGDMSPHALPEFAPALRHPAVAGMKAWTLTKAGQDPHRVRSLARAALHPDARRSTPLAARLSACRALLLADDLSEAALGLTDALMDARRRHAFAAGALALLQRAELHLRRGVLDEARADMVAARAEFPGCSWHPAVLPAFFVMDVMLHLESGRIDEAERTAAAELPAGAESGPLWGNVLYVRGKLHMAKNEPAQALPLLRECGRVLLSRDCTNPAVLLWRSSAAAAYFACGSTEVAHRLVRDELDLAIAWGAPSTIGRVQLARSRVLSGAPARQALEDGVRELRNSPAVRSYANAVTELASARFSDGDRTGAAELLQTAGLPALSRLSDAAARRVHELGSQLVGHDLPQLVLEANGDTLSAASRRVAAMAAAGRTNHEIARSLSVTPRAVERMLARIYRKLGLAGRSELRAALARLDEGS
jgi:DNA-binding CsgD family transcriptional regulator